MKKVKLFCKTTLALATMLLLGGGNVWGDVAMLNQNSSKLISTSNPNVTFSITDLGNWTDATGSSGLTQGKHGAGYEVNAKTNAVITWRVSEESKALKITKVIVSASCAENGWTARGFDVLTSVSGQSKKSGTGGGNTVKTVELGAESGDFDTYFLDIDKHENGYIGSVTIQHGDTKMYVYSVEIVYTIEDLPTFYFEAIAPSTIGGSVDVNVTNKVVANKLSASSASTSATFTATADSEHEYQFEGWYATSDFSGERVSNENPYYTTMNNTEAGSTTSLTLYAHFVQDYTPSFEIKEGADAMLVDDAVAVASMFTTEHTPSLVYTLEDNEGVLSLADGTLTALKAGTAIIVATQEAVPGIKYGQAKFTITVSKHDLTFTKSENLRTAYLVNDESLSLAELWTNNGTGGTTTYEITSFVAAEGEQTGATAPAIANNVLTLGEAGVLVLKASFTGSAKYKDGEDTHTITISRRTNGVLNVTGADIKNTWNQSINLSDYISKENTDGELVVGVSSDSEVATYDAETKQFALGTKTGTASFSVSITQTYQYEAVAAKTFAITANQSFYAYAEGVILNAGNSLSGFNNSSFLTGLSQTLNQSEAEGILSNLRTEAKTYMNNHVFSAANVSFLLDNNSFEFADHNYGWSNISGYSAKTGTSSPYGEYAMQITKGVMSSIDAGYIEQYVTLHKGHYRLSAFVKLSYVDGAKLSFGNKELTINRTTEGQVYSVEFDVLSDNENVKISFSHPSQYDTYGKEVLIDNLEITYWSLNDLSLVAMNNEDGTDYYYATFSNADYAVEFGNDVEVYTVSVDGDRMTLYPVSNNQVPANNGVLIKSQSNNILYKYISSAADLSNNMLQPGTGAETTSDVECRFYRLAYYDYAAKTGLGFYYGSGCPNGEAFMCKAGLAYLAVPKTTAEAPARFLLDRQDISTDLLNVNVNDNQGKKVMMNGVLYIIRDGKTYDSFGRLVK